MAAVALAEAFAPEKLRVGLFADARLQPRWVAEAFALDLDVAFALGRLDEAPRIAYQSWARTYPLSVSRNRPALLEKTAQFPLRALREAQRSGREWLEQRPAAPQAPEKRGLSLISIGSRIVRRNWSECTP